MFGPWTLHVMLRALGRDERQRRCECSQPELGQGWSVRSHSGVPSRNLKPQASALANPPKVDLARRVSPCRDRPIGTDIGHLGGSTSASRISGNISPWYGNHWRNWPCHSCHNVTRDTPQVPPQFHRRVSSPPVAEDASKKHGDTGGEG